MNLWRVRGMEVLSIRDSNIIFYPIEEKNNAE
jgi:hypothetical protein